MRRSILLGYGLAGAILVQSTATAQFAADRPATPAPFGGALPTAAPTPAARPASAAPTLPTGFQPANQLTPASPFARPERREAYQQIPSSIPAQPQAPHVWAVKADHGGWMICVKSYIGEESRSMAERLAKEIREKHKVASYLFERNAEERAAELAQIDLIRKSEQLKNQPLIEIQNQARKAAEVRGEPYIESPLKLKIPKPAMEMQEQWAVLIGGFPTMEAARKALDTVRKLPAPTDTTLLDRTSIGVGGEEATGIKSEFKSSWNFVNPYACAMVVPNPAAAKANQEEKHKLEPFIVKINLDVKNSLLKATKPWTLIVRTFSVPTKMVGKDGGGGNIFTKLFSPERKSMLDVTGDEAERLAESLRHRNMMQPNMTEPFEAFVLHLHMGSIVTVGQFDGPDDPKLLETQRILKGITFNMMKSETVPVMGKDGRPDVQRMFDSVSPFPVPKYSMPKN